MVNLPDGGILRQQQPVPAANVSHVAHENKSSRELPPSDERNATEQKRRVGTALDLLDDGQPRCEGVVDQSRLEAEGAEGCPVDGAHNADAVQRAHSIRRGEADAPPVVDHDHAIPHPGRVLDRQIVIGEREDAIGHHQRQTFEQVEVDALERSPAAGGLR